MLVQAALRRGAVPIALTCCVTLFGCAGGGMGSVAPPDRSGRFEGWYQGQQIPSSGNGPSCRARARGVWFAVEGGTIEMRGSRRRRGGRGKADLFGTVSPGGAVAMRQVEGKRTVVGRIEGDRLTAADVTEGQRFQGGDRVPCAYRYEATRRQGASSPGRDGETTAAADGPPPI